MNILPALLRAPLYPALALCLLASCKKQRDPSAAETPSPRSFYEWVEESWEHPDCRTETDEACVTLSFRYPRFHAESAFADSLQRWVEKQIYYPEPDAPRTTGEELAREWFEDYDYYAREIEGYSIAWRLERRIEVVYSTANLISLHLYEYSFSGGAHPSEIELFRSFALPEGRIINLRDLTYDNFYLNRLEQLAEEQYRYTYELLEGDPLADSGSNFLEGDFRLPENFAFTRYGLLFHFNPWEVAPYVTGPITIELSYEDLETILRPRWLYPERQMTLL